MASILRSTLDDERRRMLARRAVFLAVMSLTWIVSSGRAQVATDTVEPGASRCSLREVERRTLSFGDLALYVEAQTLGFVDGRPLIVGQPVFEWFVAADGRRTLATDGRILGVLLADQASGEAPREIGFPDGIDHVGWVRGVALDASRWGFVMQEIDGPSVALANTMRVVYAEYDFGAVVGRDRASGSEAGRWTLVETVVAAADVLPAGALQRDPTTGAPVWTALVRNRPGVDAVTFARTRAGWKRTVVFPDWANDATTRIEPDGTRRVAIAGLDPDFDHQLASIRIEMPGGADGSKRIDVGRLDDQFRGPVFSGPDDVDPDLAWIAPGSEGTTVRVAVDVSQGSDDESAAQYRQRSAVLDPSADAVHYAGVADGASVWVTRHASTFMGEPTLRVLQMTPDGPRAIGFLTYPFLGDFAVLPESPGTFFVIGPDVDMAPFTPSVRSLLIRLSIDCT